MLFLIVHRKGCGCVTWHRRTCSLASVRHCCRSWGGKPQTRKQKDHTWPKKEILESLQTDSFFCKVWDLPSSIVWGFQVCHPTFRLGVSSMANSMLDFSGLGLQAWPGNYDLLPRFQVCQVCQVGSFKDDLQHCRVRGLPARTSF